MRNSNTQAQAAMLRRYEHVAAINSVDGAAGAHHAGLLPCFAALLLLTAVPPARGGNNGWFNTYDSTVEKGETEVAILADFISPSRFRREGDGIGHYTTQVLELERAPTHRYVTELYIEGFQRQDTGESRYSGFRWENRYRLCHHKTWLDPMVYLEYENIDALIHHKLEVTGWINPPYESAGPDAPREHDLEAKLILSHTLDHWDLAFNAIAEHNLDSGLTEFGFTVGAMRYVRPRAGSRHAISGRPPLRAQLSAPAARARACIQCKGPPRNAASPAELLAVAPDDGCSCGSDMRGCRCAHCNGPAPVCPCHARGTLGYGFELLGALGDSRKFAIDFSRQEQYLAPLVQYQLTGHTSVRLEAPIGLSALSDSLTRLAVSCEF